MPQPAILVNGVSYNWGSIVILLGTNILYGITELNFKKQQDKSNNMGVGNEPVSRGYGNNKYDASIESYNSLLRARMAQSLTESVVAQESTGDVIQRLSQVFMGEQWKIEQITRTELHGVYAQGKLAGMRQLWDDGEGTIPDLKKTLYHPMDKRTGEDSKWLNENNLIVPVDEPFKYTWKGVVREYMAPPDRPNDRSILIPYRDAWG